MAYNSLGQYKEAIRSFQQAVRMNSKFISAFDQLGDTYMRAGRLKEAISAYEQVVDLNSGSVEAHYKLALPQFLWGKRNLTLRQYEVLKALNPEMAEKLYHTIDKDKILNVRHESAENGAQIIGKEPEKCKG